MKRDAPGGGERPSSAAARLCLSMFKQRPKDSRQRHNGSAGLVGVPHLLIMYPSRSLDALTVHTSGPPRSKLPRLHVTHAYSDSKAMQNQAIMAG